jgi:hypothetical protein
LDYLLRHWSEIYRSFDIHLHLQLLVRVNRGYLCRRNLDGPIAFLVADHGTPELPELGRSELFPKYSAKVGGSVFDVERRHTLAGLHYHGINGCWLIPMLPQLLDEGADDADTVEDQLVL